MEFLWNVLAENVFVVCTAGGAVADHYPLQILKAKNGLAIFHKFFDLFPLSSSFMHRLTIIASQLFVVILSYNIPFDLSTTFPPDASMRSTTTPVYNIPSRCIDAFHDHTSLFFSKANEQAIQTLEAFDNGPYNKGPEIGGLEKYDGKPDCIREPKSKK